MTTRLFKDHPIITRVTETYGSNSVYWPVRWNANYVLTANRKRVIRNRSLTVMLWLGLLVLFALILLFISNLNPRVSAPESVNPGNFMYMEQPLDGAPVNSQPDPKGIDQNQWMDEQEWQDLRQKTHEWLGC